MNRAWILVGMMGAGKSSLGRALAQLAERPFYDTDTLLQNRLGRTISQIFQTYGEPTFRDHESSILRDLEAGELVLATGGGIVLRDENWSEMRRLGKTCYLRVPPSVLIQRLEKSRKKRPLLETEDWEGKLQAMLCARECFYERADVIFDVPNEDLEPVAQRLFKILIQPDSAV